MALSILDSDVIYRYELEVFIDHMLIKKLTKDPDRKRTVSIDYVTLKSYAQSQDHATVIIYNIIQRF